MKAMLLFGLLGALAWTAVRVLPPETRERLVASSGAGTFFSQTLPRYLRNRFGLSDDPVKTRAALIGGLSTHLEQIERRVDAQSALIGSARSTPVVAARMRDEVAATRAELSRSAELLRRLEEENPKSGVAGRATTRILDAMLPQSSSPPVCQSASEQH